MPAFFIVTIEIPDKNDRGSYDAYIEQVKPIVEGFGGKVKVLEPAYIAKALQAAAENILSRYK